MASLVTLPFIWCLLSSSFGWKDWLTGFGLGTAAWLASRLLLPAPGNARFPRLHMGPLLLFFPVALLDMFGAVLHLAPMVLKGRAHTTESAIRIHLRHPLTRLLLCGAITMSPGTISVQLVNDILHVLTLIPAETKVRMSGTQEAEHLQSILFRAEGGKA